MTASISVPLPRRRRADAGTPPERHWRLGGFCFPGDPGSEIDQMAARSLLARSGRLEVALAPLRHELHPALRQHLDALKRQPAADRIRSFDDAAAAVCFGWKPDRIIDDRPFEPALADQLAWLLVSWAGVGRDGFTHSPAGFDLGRLWWRQPGVVLGGISGPVALFRAPERVRVVAATGPTITLPRLAALRSRSGAGIVDVLGNAAGFPVLNPVPAVQALSGELADPAEVEAAIPRVEAGLALLRSVWPAAAAFAQRWLRGLVILSDRGMARSHTSVHTPQALWLTAGSPPLVAEAFCHELAHARMNLVLEHDPVLDVDGVARYRSPWRRDLRPLHGLLAGVHAFVNVCEFYRRFADGDERHQPRAQAVIDRQRLNCETAWDIVRREARWTALGEGLAADLDKAVRQCGRGS